MNPESMIEDKITFTLQWNALQSWTKVSDHITCMLCVVFEIFCRLHSIHMECYPCVIKCHVSSWMSSISHVIYMHPPSSLQLVPTSHLIIFMDTEKSCHWLRSHYPGIRCLVLECLHPQQHAPMLSCVFEKVHGMSRTDVVVYVDAEIIVPMSKWDNDCDGRYHA